MGMSDIRVRRSRLLRATPRRHPDAGTSFGSQTAHGRQTVREPDVRMSRRYGTAAPRGSSINQTVVARSAGSCAAALNDMPDVARSVLSRAQAHRDRYRTRTVAVSDFAGDNHGPARPGTPDRCAIQAISSTVSQSESSASIASHLDGIGWESDHQRSRTTRAVCRRVTCIPSDARSISPRNQFTSVRNEMTSLATTSGAVSIATCP